MTAKQLYEYILIELNKENAPNILLEDFNYFANKAINQYINKRYNIYDINQQTTDDLRVLKATALLTPHKVESVYDGLSLVNGGMATYYVDLPMDYLHLLNCICIYNVKKTYKCYNAGDTWRAAATRLTADMYSQVLDNFWTKPTYKRPYYYIHNINTSESVPTNPYDNNSNTGTDFNPIELYNIPQRKYGTYHILGFVDMSNGETVPSGTTGVYLVHYSNENRTKSDEVAIVEVVEEGGETVETVTFEAIDHTSAYQIPDKSIYICNKGITVGSDIYYEWELKETFSTDRSGHLIIDYPDKDMFSSIQLSDRSNLSTVERSALQRYGNTSKVRLEIRYGQKIINR